MGNQSNQANQANQEYQSNQANQSNQSGGLFSEASNMIRNGASSLENTADSWESDLIGKSKKYSDDDQNYGSQPPSLVNSASNLCSKGESWASGETQKLKNTAGYWENKIMGTNSTQDSNTGLRRVPARQTPTRAEFKTMGEKFLDDESKRKGINSPPILDSEAEVMGRLVWRVYLAEK